MVYRIFTPIDLREEVREWNEEYRRIKGLIEEISELNREIIRSYVRRKRGRGGGGYRSKSTG